MSVVQRRGGKTNRKHRRNYRWAGVDHAHTKYVTRHTAIRDLPARRTVGKKAKGDHGP